MSYPFVNQQYAQHSSQGHRSYDHNGTSYDQHDGHHYGGGSGDSAYGREATTAPHSGYGGGYQQEPYEMRAVDNTATAPRLPEKDSEYDDGAVGARKMYNEGNSPYGPMGANGGGGGGVYGNSKSIWTHDDKRVMAKRGVMAKLFRVLFCIVINAIIVIVAIICLVVMFARPFNVGIGAMTAPSTSSVGISGSALTFNGSVDFIVSNPNSISSELSLTAKVYDDADKSQDIGRGSVSKSKIGANANSTIHFPYQVRYDPSADKNKAILKDLVSKCGLTGGQRQNLDLTLDIDASLSILSVPVPVSFSQAVSFQCPLSSDVLKNIGGGDLLQIIGSLGGRSTKRDEL